MSPVSIHHIGSQISLALPVVGHLKLTGSASEEKAEAAQREQPAVSTLSMCFKAGMRAGDGAQWVECLPSVQNARGSTLSFGQTRHGGAHLKSQH